MADTSGFKEIIAYVVGELSNDYNTELTSRDISIGNHGNKKRYNGVSYDGGIVVRVVNHGGNTSGGNKPSGKLHKAYAECFFLSLVKARIRIMAFTNLEFYRIFKEDSEGLMDGIDLIYVKLPVELEAKAKRIQKIASDEMN